MDDNKKFCCVEIISPSGICSSANGNDYINLYLNFTDTVIVHPLKNYCKFGTKSEANDALNYYKQQNPNMNVFVKQCCNLCSWKNKTNDNKNIDTTNKEKPLKERALEQLKEKYEKFIFDVVSCQVLS